MSYGPEWVIEGILARSSRPGYPAEAVPIETIDSWIGRVREMGVNSVICFLAEEQLDFYPGASGGLLGRYIESDLVVLHLPEKDHLRPALSDENLSKAVSGFAELQKPVLVHCSAGIDRTGLAIRAIMDEATASETSLDR